MVSITRAPAQSIPVAREKAEAIVRFDIHQRIQHIMMFTSFLTLTFTGLPQKFSSLAISQWWIGGLGGAENIRTIHHYAAYVMIACCAYHMAYILFTTVVMKRPFPFHMLPSLKDIRDFFQEIRYFAGLSKQEPKFDRFSYREKFDYWAVFWGMAIIGVSGLVLMFPVFFAKFLPGFVVPVALVAHSDEAVLAVGWIFIVHFYFAHLQPRVFPLNTSIFTGKMRKGLYKLEHPLEFERITGRREARPARPAAVPTVIQVEEPKTASIATLTPDAPDIASQAAEKEAPAERFPAA